MSELSMHELEAQTGEVLPEREALSAFGIGSFNHHTHVTAINASNALASGFGTAISSAHQTVIVSG